jgi:hypothetical protein
VAIAATSEKADYQTLSRVCGRATGAYAAMLSNNSGPLFRGEPTRRSTGQVRSNPSGAGRISAG